MKLLAFTKRFEKDVRKLAAHDQEKVQRSIERLWAGLQEGYFPVGLGLKKIAKDKYEIRVDLKIRIAIKAQDDTFTLHVVGNHQDIERFLKNY